MKLGKYIHERIILGQIKSGVKGHVTEVKCTHVLKNVGNSRKTSSIVTKLVHMNLTWSPRKEFDDERFATDPRSRSEVKQKRCMCIHDNSRKTSSIVTKLIHMNLTWSRTTEFEDDYFPTDPRSRLQRSNVQNIYVR